MRVGAGAHRIVQLPDTLPVEPGLIALALAIESGLAGLEGASARGCSRRRVMLQEFSHGADRTLEHTFDCLGIISQVNPRFVGIGRSIK